MWYVAVENQSGKECAEHTLKTDQSGHRGTEKQESHDEDILRHGIAKATKEPTCQAWQNENTANDKQHYLKQEQRPERQSCPAAERAHDGCQHDEGKGEGYHRGPHTERHAGMLLQTVFADDRVGDESV